MSESSNIPDENPSVVNSVASNTESNATTNESESPSRLRNQETDGRVIVADPPDIDDDDEFAGLPEEEEDWDSDDYPEDDSDPESESSPSGESDEADDDELMDNPSSGSGFSKASGESSQSGAKKPPTVPTVTVQEVDDSRPIDESNIDKDMVVEEPVDIDDD